MTITATGHPPKAPLALRVAVTGHRPARLPQDTAPLQAVLASLLADIGRHVHDVAAQNATTHAFDGHPPRLMAVSSLAEGADTLFAEQALAAGWELGAVLPFTRDDAAADLLPPRAVLPDARARWQQLVDHPRTTVLELDGHLEHRREAYATAGQVLANQCDLMVMVWDGKHVSKRGGTEQAAAAARRMGVPVLWVGAAAPHAWCVVDGQQRLPLRDAGDPPISPIPTGNADALGIALRGLLLPPQGPSQTHWADHYAAKRPRWNPGFAWKPFRDLFGKGRWTWPELAAPSFESQLGPEWQAQPAASGPAPGAGAVHRLRAPYAWADGLAVQASNLYRSSFVLGYLAAAAAVGMALLPLALGLAGSHHPVETLATVIEGAAILGVLAVVALAARRGWHVRWIDERLLAELLRQQRLVTPLAGQRPLPAVPAHLGSYDDPAGTWMAWYARAWDRSLGLPPGRLSGERLIQALDDVRLVVSGPGGQIDYHDGTAQVCANLEHRLHRIGYTLFGLTLLACALHLVPPFVGHAAEAWLPPHGLTFLAAFLPALGAALAGIVNQGEFRRIAKRSRAMAKKLRDIDRRIQQLQQRLRAGGVPSDENEPQPSAVAARLADEAARLMVHEVLDWRVMLTDRPAELPA